MEFDNVINTIKSYEGADDNIVVQIKDAIDKFIGISTGNDFVDEDGNKLLDIDIIGSWSFDNSKNISTHPTAEGYSLSDCMSSEPKEIQVNGTIYNTSYKISALETRMLKTFSSVQSLTGIIGVDTSKVIEKTRNLYINTKARIDGLLQVSQSVYKILSTSDIKDSVSLAFGEQQGRIFKKLIALDKIQDEGIIFDLQPYGMRKRSYVLKQVSSNINSSDTDEDAEVSLSFVEFNKSDDNIYSLPMRNSVGTLTRQMKVVAEMNAKKADTTTLYDIQAKATEMFSS